MDSVKVSLYGQHLGDVYLDGRNVVTFRYAEDFTNSSLDPSPFVLEKRPQAYQFFGRDFRHFHHLPGMLADSLPDKFGSDLLLSYLRAIGRNESSLNAIERLSYAGDRAMGALEYRPQHSLLSRDQGNDQIDLDLLVKIADKVLAGKLQLNVNADSKTLIEKIIGIGTSAGGARAKAIIARNREGNIISGALDKLPDGYKHEILKLEGETTKDYGRAEYSYYQLAREAEINMMPSMLIESGDYAHFTTERFDRTPNGDKVHIQTLAGLQHLDFNYDTYSYEGVLGMVNQLSGDRKQIEDVFRRMVFNVISCNRDDHAKNTAFMMDRNGDWSITPAYDLCYTYTEQMGTWSNVHHTSINDKVSQISAGDFLVVAKEYDIEKPKEIIQQVLDAFSRFPELAKKNGIGKEKIDVILKNTNAIYKELGFQKYYQQTKTIAEPNIEETKRRGLRR